MCQVRCCVLEPAREPVVERHLAQHVARRTPHVARTSHRRTSHVARDSPLCYHPGCPMTRFLFPAVVILTVAIGAQSKPPASKPSTEWPTYGYDAGGTRFSPLTQLTPQNVPQLEVAWEYHMRPAPPPGAPPAPAPTPGRGRGRGSGFAVSGVTPLVIDGVMYIGTPYGRIVALDSS